MRASGVGSFPGDEQRDYEAWLRFVLGDLGGDDHGLAFLPEVPGRGAPAGMVGRTLGAITELDADLQPAGWRLTGTQGSPAIDQRRARSLLGQDLDALEERAQEHVGAFKVQVAGPWTLAAMIERPRGDKVLADHGARRDLAQALAEAVREHVRDVRRRLPGLDRLVVQVDEPMLPAVLGGEVPTASGFSRHRSVDRPEASAALEWVLGAIGDEGAEPWVHCCAQEAPLDLVRGAGARGLMVDHALLTPHAHDVLAMALEAGETVALGLVPSADPEREPAGLDVVGAVERWLDLVGLDVDAVSGGLVLTPACGQAGASPGWARRALGLLLASARG